MPETGPAPTEANEVHKRGFFDRLFKPEDPKTDVVKPVDEASSGAPAQSETSSLSTMDELAAVPAHTDVVATPEPETIDLSGADTQPAIDEKQGDAASAFNLDPLAHAERAAKQDDAPTEAPSIAEGQTEPDEAAKAPADMQAAHDDGTQGGESSKSGDASTSPESPLASEATTIDNGTVETSDNGETFTLPNHEATETDTPAADAAVEGEGVTTPTTDQEPAPEGPATEEKSETEGSSEIAVSTEATPTGSEDSAVWAEPPVDESASAGTSGQESSQDTSKDDKPTEAVDPQTPQDAGVEQQVATNLSDREQYLVDEKAETKPKADGIEDGAEVVDFADAKAAIQQAREALDKAEAALDKKAA